MFLRVMICYEKISFVTNLMAFKSKILFQMILTVQVSASQDLKMSLWNDRLIDTSGVRVVGKDLVKFIYSEKATKFCKIFTLLLTGNT